MNGVIRRRGLMSEIKEKGPIINTYVRTYNVSASAAGVEKRSDLVFIEGASYEFNVEFSSTCTYIRFYINNKKTQLGGNVWGNTASFIYDCTVLPDFGNYTIMLWKPSDGTLTLTITETIPRT